LVADRGPRVYLMHGKGDYLTGTAFCREAGCTLLPDPSVIDLYGEPVLLMHGDSLCTRDEAYMRHGR
ncbi:UDP-2,3-diacylglucosamine hydrolase, partial [Klebsiella pneumoniae]